MILCLSKPFILTLTLTILTLAPNNFSKSVCIKSNVKKEGALPS